MTFKNEIKGLIARKGHSITSLNNALNEKKGTNKTTQNLHIKIANETISYREILEIADILGYEIIWKEKDV